MHKSWLCFFSLDVQPSFNSTSDSVSSSYYLGDGRIYRGSQFLAMSTIITINHNIHYALLGRCWFSHTSILPRVFDWIDKNNLLIGNVSSSIPNIGFIYFRFIIVISEYLFTVIKEEGIVHSFGSHRVRGRSCLEPSEFMAILISPLSGGRSWFESDIL